MLQQAALEAVGAALTAVSPVVAGQGRRRAAKAGRRKGTATKAARRPKRSKGQKRNPEELAKLTETLLREIKRKGGRRIEEIGQALAVPTKELTLPIKKLIEGKKIKSTGQRRATRYTAR